MTLRNAGGSGISTKAYQQSNQGNRPRNYVLFNSAPAQFWQPAWGGKNTTIRILPAGDPDNPGHFLPTRIDDPTGASEAAAFSPWIARYWMLRRFGDPKIVMTVASDEVEANDVLAQSPGSVLRKAVLRAIERRVEKAGWGGLVNGTNALLTPTKLCCLVQCFLFRWNSKSYISIPGKPGKQPPRGARPDDQIVVMLLPPSAANALMRAMDTEDAEPWQIDPVAIDRGAYVHIFERGSDPIRRPVSSDDMYSSKPVEEAASGGDTFKGYDVTLTETLDGQPLPNDIDASLRGREALVASKIRPWDKLVQIRSYEDQLRLLSHSFLTCPDKNLRDILVDVTKYAFGDQAHLLPDAIRDYGRTVVAKTPATAPQSREVKNPTYPPTEPPKDDIYSQPVSDTSAEEPPEDAEGSSELVEFPPKDEVPVEEPPSEESIKQAMAEATKKAKARATARAKSA